MNLYRHCVLLVTVFLCTGCMAGAAIITYPESLKLNPEPPRNYELSLDILVASKSYHIDYSWNCEQKKHFTASVMRWVLSWRSEFKVVAKQIDDGMTLFFRQPSSAYCASDSANFIPKVLLTNGENQPTSATFFVARYDTKESKVVSDAVVQGIVRRVQAPSILGKMTSKEEDLAISLTSRLDYYVSRNVSVAAEAAWTINSELDQIFSKLTETTRAMDLLPKNSRRSGIFQFIAWKSYPKGWKSPEPLRHYAPILHEGRLVLDGQPLEAKSRVFRFESGGGSENTIEFCYLGQCLPLEGAFNEIYYPTSRELVSVSRSNLKYVFSD